MSNKATARVLINRFLFKNKGDWFTAEAVSDVLDLHRGKVTRLLRKLYKDRTTKIYTKQTFDSNGDKRSVYSFREDMG